MSNGASDYVDLIRSIGVPGLQTVTWPDPADPARFFSCIGSGRRGGMAEGQCVLVFLNDIRMDDPERTKAVISPSEVGYVIYLRPGEAGIAYGTGSQNGVLLIYTKEYRKK